MRRLSILALTALLLTGLALADDPAPDTKSDKSDKGKKEKTKAAEEEVLEFTTEDLERKYGPSSKPAPKSAAGPGAPEGASPLEQLQASQRANKDKAAQREEARQRVQAAQARIKGLEKRVAQLRNPLLGRAEPEEGEKAAWSASDQAGRVKIAQDSIAAARKELEEAVQEMSRLR